MYVFICQATEPVEKRIKKNRVNVYNFLKIIRKHKVCVGFNVIIIKIIFLSNLSSPVHFIPIWAAWQIQSRHRQQVTHKRRIVHVCSACPGI